MKIVFFIFIIALAGCRGFVIDKVVIGKFHLIAVDDDEDLSISYDLNGGGSIGVVNETVYAVGHNDKYIIVKQHPHKFAEELSKTITNYYIVPVFVRNQYWIEKEVIGPLTRDQFEQKKKELNIFWLIINWIFWPVSLVYFLLTGHLSHGQWQSIPKSYFN